MVVKQVQNAIRLFLRRLDTHPMTTTCLTVGGFAAAGIVTWNVLEFLEGPPAVDPKKQPMTLEEARLRAMIENAQSSDWRENLDNAVTAQEQFMLPGRPHEKPKFMEEIDRRSLEIMKEQHEEVAKEKQRKPTTRVWND